MRKNTITKTLAPAAAATLIVSGCSQGSSSHDSHGGSESGSSQVSAQFNDADVTYAEGMIMHHQQAVEMSDIILDKSGVNPDVVKMAKQIKKAQGQRSRRCRPGSRTGVRTTLATRATVVTPAPETR